jgi:signal transduction histidine kinase/ActR/RegA family two-component response regulator
VGIGQKLGEWLKPPHFDDVLQAERARILHVAMLVTGTIVAVSGVVGWNRMQPGTPAFLAIYIALSFGGLVLIRRGRVRLVGLLYCSSLWASVVAGHLVFGHPDAALVASFLNIMLIAGFGVGSRAAIAFGVMGLAWVSVMGWAVSTGRLAEPSAGLRPLDIVIQVSFTFFVTAVLAGYGLRRQGRALAAVQSSENRQARLASRHQVLAELGQRVVECEDSPAFTQQVAEEIHRVTEARTVAVYIPGASTMELAAWAGESAPPALELPSVEPEEGHATGVVMVSPPVVGLGSQGCLAWHVAATAPTSALLVLRDDPLADHDEVLVRGSAALLDAALRRLDTEQQLRHAQRMETVGQLTGGVAHDFNNLLTTIIGGANLVLDEAETDLQKQILGDVVRAGEHAAVLTHRLLSFSRDDMLEFRRLDLRDVACSLSGVLKRMVGTRIDLVFPPAGHPIWIRGDPSSLEQIIINLVLNARDASSGRGRVELGVSSDAGDQPGGRAVLEVRDNGSGMDEATLARIFDPFFTTKPAGEGTGLGLSAVRAATDALGGKIDVTSKLTEGTQFRVLLPLAPQLDDGARTDDALSVAPARDGESVLLVDDHELVRRTLAAVLRSAGYQVVEAEDGVAALAKLDRGLVPSAIVSDVIMPRMDGLELVKELSRRQGSAPIVLLSGYADVDANQARRELKHISVLRKPTTAEALTETLRGVIDGAAESTDA